MKVWYTIQRHEKVWTVWRFTEFNCKEHGGFGSLGIYSSSTKKNCIEYCKNNNIKVRRV